MANALVCKTSIRGFNSRPVLHKINELAIHTLLLASMATPLGKLKLPPLNSAPVLLLATNSVTMRLPLATQALPLRVIARATGPLKEPAV